jgi:hypothetical protein
VLQVTVGTHWSEDTLGFPPEETRPLRLDAAQQQRSLSRGLPSICLFSVLLGKCVAFKQEYFRDAAGWWMLSVVQDGLRVFALGLRDFTRCRSLVLEFVAYVLSAVRIERG